MTCAVGVCEEQDQVARRGGQCDEARGEPIEHLKICEGTVRCREKIFSFSSWLAIDGGARRSVRSGLAIRTTYSTRDVGE